MTRTVELAAGVVLLISTALAARFFVRAAFGRASSRRMDWVDLVATEGTLFAALLTLIGLATARAGLFTLPSMAAPSLALAAILSRVSVPHITDDSETAKIGSRDTAWNLLVLAITASAGAWWILHRHQEIDGLRDGGVYAASAVELARTGNFGWVDPLIGRFGIDRLFFLHEYLSPLPFDGYPDFLRFPGFYLNPGNGTVSPQFLGGYEVGLALCYKLAGPQAMLALNAAWAMLGLAGFAAVARKAVGSMGSAAAVAMMTANVAVGWYARNTGNEAMVLALIWGGLALYFHTTAEVSQPIVLRRWLPTLGVALTLAVTKFSAWFMLPALAFDIAQRRAADGDRRRGGTIFLLVMLAALIAFLHAAIFAPYYSYGLWKTTLSKSGIKWSLLPALWFGGIAAAWCCGQWIGELRLVAQKRAPANAALVPRWKWIAAAGVGCAIALFLLRTSVADASAKQDIWTERANLSELAFYFPYGMLPLLFAGCAGWICTTPRRLVLPLVLLLAAGMYLLVKRNLDPLHPWSSRRWIPALIPCLCLGLGWWIQRLMSLRMPRIVRISAAGVVCATTVALCWSASRTTQTARQYDRLIPQMDQLGSKFYREDLILLQPTGNLVKLAGWMKARFDQDWYRIEASPAAWDQIWPILQTRASEGSRIIFITDMPIPANFSGWDSITTVVETRLSYPVLREMVRALPQAKPEQVSLDLWAYQLHMNKAKLGWWPGQTSTAVVPPPKSRIPADLAMSPAAAPFVAGLYEPTVLPTGAHYRWTDGRPRFRVGTWLDQSSLPTTSPLRLDFVLASGRSAGVTVPVSAVLDFGLRDRQRSLGTTTVGSSWTTWTLELRPHELKPDSWIEFQMPRPPVSDRIGGGILGICVQSLRAEDGATTTSAPSDKVLDPLQVPVGL